MGGAEHITCVHFPFHKALQACLVALPADCPEVWQQEDVHSNLEQPDGDNVQGGRGLLCGAQACSEADQGPADSDSRCVETRRYDSTAWVL